MSRTVFPVDEAIYLIFLARVHYLASSNKGKPLQIQDPKLELEKAVDVRACPRLRCRVCSVCKDLLRT